MPSSPPPDWVASCCTTSLMNLAEKRFWPSSLAGSLPHVCCCHGVRGYSPSAAGFPLSEGAPSPKLGSTVKNKNKNK